MAVEPESDDGVPLEVDDRIRLLTLAILRTAPANLKLATSQQLTDFLGDQVRSAVLPSALSGLLQLVIGRRCDPADLAKWLHAPDDVTPFDLVSRPRGRPPVYVKRNLERAAGRLASYEDRIQEQRDRIADAEAVIADAQREIQARENDKAMEENFLLMSNFYLVLEALALANQKALGMGPMFTIAKALGDLAERDRVAFVLRELHADEALQSDLADAVFAVTERHLAKAVRARQTVDSGFDPNETGSFANAQTPVSSAAPEDFPGSRRPAKGMGTEHRDDVKSDGQADPQLHPGEDPADMKTDGMAADPSALSEEELAVPAPPSFAHRLPSVDATNDDPFGRE